MPKAKKLRAPALESKQVRHEPLGQAIEGDILRGKYAAPSRGRRKQSNQGAQNEEYLDEKTSKKILDMSREQQMEEEIDEQRKWHSGGKQRNNSSMSNDNDYDDSDEEEVEEIEEIILDDDEEE
jgi:hypothetical protein